MADEREKYQGQGTSQGAAGGSDHLDQPHVGALEARMIFAFEANDQTAISNYGSCRQHLEVSSGPMRFAPLWSAILLDSGAQVIAVPRQFNLSLWKQKLDQSPLGPEDRQVTQYRHQEKSSIQEGIAPLHQQLAPRHPRVSLRLRQAHDAHVQVGTDEPHGVKKSRMSSRGLLAMCESTVCEDGKHQTMDPEEEPIPRRLA